MASHRPVALVTGGSRGIGAATVVALADHGYDVAFTYRNKVTRADTVVRELRRRKASVLAQQCDITHVADLDRFFSSFDDWRSHLDILVLNASGGLERDLVSVNPDYPFRINRDAQLAMLDRALGRMTSGGCVVLVTSHWAHLYGQVEQLPGYEPVAASKWAGERALRDRIPDMDRLEVRLLVVTGDLIEGTITPKLLERTAPGLTDERRQEVGSLPTADEMGAVIVRSARDPSIPSGQTIAVGGSLTSLPRMP